MLTKSQMPKLRPIPLGDASIRRWEFLEDWTYQWGSELLVILKGSIIDGASIPQLFRNIYSPVGYLLIASAHHDLVYQNGFYLKHLVIIDANWDRPLNEQETVRVYVTREEADQMFKEIANIEYPKRWFATSVAVGALKVGGWAAWNRYRKLDPDYVEPPVEKEYDWND